MNNDHIELVFNGLYDRISGNETYASRYLGGVLWANEPSQMLVSGNEGFLDNVSDTVKKAWEYIKKFLKYIKDTVSAFFKSGKIKNASASVKESLKVPEADLSDSVESKLKQASERVQQIIDALENVTKDGDDIKDFLKTDEIFKLGHGGYVAVLEKERDRLVKALKDVQANLQNDKRREALQKCDTLLTIITGINNVYGTGANGVQRTLDAIEHSDVKNDDTNMRIKTLKWILKGFDALCTQMISATALVEKIAKIK